MMKKIALRDLTNKTIDELLIYSLDQALYSVRVFNQGNYYEVKKGLKLYRAFSIGHIHRDFSAVNIKKVTLIQDSAYDEMVGQPVREESNRMVMSAAPQVNVYAANDD